MKIRADLRYQGNVTELPVDERQKRICRLTHMRPSKFESFWTSDAKERVDRQDSEGTEQAVAVDFQPLTSHSRRQNVVTSKLQDSLQHKTHTHKSHNLSTLRLKYHLEISIRNYIVTTIRQVHGILTSMPIMIDRYASPVSLFC